MDPVSGSPNGHHFTLDFVHGGDLKSLRFTRVLERDGYVLDRKYPVNAGGLLVVTVPNSSTAYDPSECS